MSGTVTVIPASKEGFGEGVHVIDETVEEMKYGTFMTMDIQFYPRPVPPKAA